jgi:uncharacterized membrane protein YhaH (DUF805 family)
MERMARWVFLRLYGITLSRGFRNSPEDACNDAIVMTGMALVMPLSTSVIVLALMIPALAIHAKRSDLAAIIVALALVVPLMRWVGKRFKTYVYTPELASSTDLRANAQRVWQHLKHDVTLARAIAVPAQRCQR